MFRRIPLFGSLSVGFAAMGVVAALAFGPPTPLQSPQSASPPPIVGTPGEPAPVTPTTDKSITPPRPATGKLAPDAPISPSIACDIQPEVIEAGRAIDKTTVDALILLLPIDRTSPDAERAMAAARAAATAFTGRVSIQVEFFDARNPSKFAESDPSGSMKVPAVLRQHLLKTHVEIMTAQKEYEEKELKKKGVDASELLAMWTGPVSYQERIRKKQQQEGITTRDQPIPSYFELITKDDRPRVMKKDDLSDSELEKLSEGSQKLWKQGLYDKESLVAWVNTVVAKEMQVNLAPGRATFRILREKDCILMFATRMPQWILFVHKQGKEELLLSEDLDEAARRGARYPNSRSWIIDADTLWGKQLYKAMTGVSPPEDRPAILGFVMLDDTFDPVLGKKKAYGPYPLDPKKECLADEIERVVGGEKGLNLPRTTAPIAVVTTQTASTGEAPPKK